MSHAEIPALLLSDVAGNSDSTARVVPCVVLGVGGKGFVDRAMEVVTGVGDGVALASGKEWW